MLEGEPFEEIFAQSSLGTSQPAEVDHVVAHLLDEFHLLFQEVALQEVIELGLCVDRTQGMQIQKGRVQVPRPENAGFHSVLGFTALLLRWLLHLRSPGFAFSRDTWRPCASPWPIRGKNGPRPPEPHRRGGNRSPEREVGVGGPTDAC